MSRDTKQCIVMRTDLNMRKGKMIAQGAHASIAFLTTAMHRVATREYPEIGAYDVVLPAAATEWLESSFKKICVRADSLDELMDVFTRAQEAGLTAHLITDNGLTEFDGVPTVTCCALGPNYSEDIDKITGEMRLL